MSRTSKMPCLSYGLPAWKCKIGGALRKIAGSVCSNCYALKGRYVLSNVALAQERRYASLSDPLWVQAMTYLVQKRKMTHFRWHDSGDLYSPEHLEQVVQVARNCPDTQFWLPTREIHLVKNYKGEIPPNLIIRLSAQMMEEFNPSYLHRYKHPNSGVTHDPSKATCPAVNQDGQCGACRQCWDPTVRTVVYLEH